MTPFYAIECMGTVLRQFAAKAKAHVDVPYSQLPGGGGPTGCLAVGPGMQRFPINVGIQPAMG